MIRKIVGILLIPFGSIAQDFPPSAGLPGSTAIHSSSIYISEWVNDVTVNQGPMDISQPGLGLASLGSAENAEGPSDPGVVSLGDGGEAIITLDNPMSNHAGFDFAVFENGFSADFLELAFVEVSSDGENYFRFASISNTDTSEQIGPFNVLDPTYIHNLAGKYQSQYGTPFDLAELDSITGLDISDITHIRIVDVVGSINENYARYDSEGKKINDPWPTAFESSGFDLESVALLLENNLGLNEKDSELDYTYLDNTLVVHSSANNIDFQVFDLNGRLLKYGSTIGVISLNELRNGVYIVHILNEVHNFAALKLLKN